MSLSTYQRLLAWARPERRYSKPGQPDRRSLRSDRIECRPSGLDELEPRLLLTAVSTGAIPDQHIQASGGSAAIDLNNFFDDTDITGTIVRFDTVFGQFDVELFDTATPNTVANFLGYVDRGDYDDTFFHRSVLPPNQPFTIVQGGGFEFTAPNNYDSIFRGPSVVNEAGVSNTRGTIAMAKLGGDPDSASNGWFFNADDVNAATLDTLNGGFTAFGRVLGIGMNVVDQIALTPIWDASSINSAFADMPLRSFDNINFPDNDDLVTLSSVTRSVQELTYSVVTTSSSRVGASVDANGVLSIFTNGVSQPETVTVTVEAEDLAGATIQASITVEVVPAKDSLDGGRTADLLWRNFKRGKNTLWEMSGFTRDGNTAIKKVNNKTWYIAAVGDFNNDGSNDLLWRNAFDGQNKVWLMNGSTFLSGVDLRTATNQNLSVGGVADFNNDGKIDILWRNTKSGRNTVWTMDGTSQTGSFRLNNQAGADWYIGGVGDLDKDGAVDVVWRNDSGGQNKVWLLNPFDGSLKQAKSLLTFSDTDWVTAGVADYNLDNQIDILLRNTVTGQQMVWVMNGTTRTSIDTSMQRLRNQDWQLPGRASQLAARTNALAKIKRLANRTASLSNSALVTAASSQSSEATATLLGSVDPIFTLDIGDDDQDTAFTLGDDGQVVR